MAHTTVHLMRHGEVHNPDDVLYGRIPGFRLSELGQEMARRMAQHLSAPSTGEPADVRLVVASPLLRAQETATPTAAAFGLELGTDPRLIEAGNHFEGLQIGHGDGSLWRPRHWPYLWNPVRPSWGEPYAEQEARMRAAIIAARGRARGHEAVLVSHQLPIWIARLSAERRRLWHDPRNRGCTLASLTSLRFDGDELVEVSYREPVAELLPGASVPGA